MAYYNTLCLAALLELRPSGQSWHRRSTNCTRSPIGSRVFFYFLLQLSAIFGKKQRKEEKKKNSHVWQSQLCARLPSQPYLTAQCVCRGGYLTAKSRVMVSWASPVTHRYISWLGRGETALSFPPMEFSSGFPSCRLPSKAKTISSSSWLQLQSDSQVKRDLTLILIENNYPKPTENKQNKRKKKKKKNTRVFPMAHLIYSRQCSKSMANPLAVMNFNSWPASK